MSDLVTLFVALSLIAHDRPASESECGWMMWGGNGDAVWEAGRLVGLVGAAERSTARTPPIYVGEGLNRDHRRDLDRLRQRARPTPQPCRE